MSSSSYYAPHLFNNNNRGDISYSPYSSCQPTGDRIRVIAARDRGIYISVMLFEGNALYTNKFDAWVGHPYNINNNINGINGDLNNDGQGVEIHTLENNSKVLAIQEAYVKKVIDTVNDLDNVLYEVGNEMGSYSLPFQYHIVNLVKSYEKAKPKQHPIGITQCYHGSSQYWSQNQTLLDSPADWISPGGEKVPQIDYVNNPVVNDGKKIVLADTDHLFGLGGTRQWIWKVFLRGHNPIWMDSYYGLSGNGPWLYATHSDIQNIRKHQGYVLNYASKMNLISMLPSNSSADCSTTYCLRNPGKEYLIYQPATASFTVNLVAGNYTYEWFNLSAGTVAQTGSITASTGNRSFNAPFSGEALLYLKLGGDTTAPNITITSPTTNETYATTSASITLGGTASDNVSVTSVTWSNSKGGSGTASGTTNWSAANIPLVSGDNIITVTAKDAAGNSAVDSIRVSYSPPSVTLSTSANKTLTVPVIDGVINESVWSLSSSAAKLILGTNNNTVTFGTLWDNNYLYVAVKVLDGNLVNDSTDPWGDDSVEIYLDGLHNHATSYDANDHQLVKGYNDAAGTFFSKNANTAGIKYVTANITGGYTAELAIPWSNLGVSAPAAGREIGFDVQQNDDDSGGDRDGILNWNNAIDANYQSTVGFGHLVLSATTVGQDAPPAAPTGLKVVQ